MTKVMRACTVIVCLVLSTVSMVAMQPPAGQEEFLPVKELPASDQLPAAPLLITAYALVWIILMAYLWSIWRRLGRVEREMGALGRQRSEGGRGR
jgi:CcmD family protein